VESQLAAKGSTLARSYTTSLSLYVVGILRRYHCCLLCKFMTLVVSCSKDFVLVWISWKMCVLNDSRLQCLQSRRGPFSKGFAEWWSTSQTRATACPPSAVYWHIFMTCTQLVRCWNPSRMEWSSSVTRIRKFTPPSTQPCRPLHRTMPGIFSSWLMFWKIQRKVSATNTGLALLMLCYYSSAWNAAFSKHGRSLNSAPVPIMLWKCS